MYVQNCALPGHYAVLSYFAAKAGNHALNLRRFDMQSKECLCYKVNVKYFVLILSGIWGHAVALLVESLHYKSEGCGYDSRWFYWIFLFI